MSKWTPAEFLRANGVEKVSPLGERAAALLEIWFSGLHNIPGDVRRINWAETYCFELTLANEVSSFDYDQMTRLVFLAHDLCLRVSIQACSPQRLRLRIHAREREGSGDRRHPTIEEALARWRHYHPAPEGADAPLIPEAQRLRELREATRRDAEAAMQALHTVRPEAAYESPAQVIAVLARQVEQAEQERDAARQQFADLAEAAQNYVELPTPPTRERLVVELTRVGRVPERW